MKSTDWYLLLTSLWQLPSGIRERKGAGVSHVIPQPTPSKVTLRLIQKINTFCALPLKLQAIH